MAKKQVTKDDVINLLNDLHIKKALIIDDKIHFDDHDAVLNILQTNLQLPEFNLFEEIQKLEYDMEELLEQAEMKETPVDVINYLREVPYFKDFFHSEVKMLKSVLEEIFESVDIKESVDTDFEFPNDTLLFLDYKLDGSPIESEEYVKCMEKFTGSNTEPWCIVFISSNIEFFKEDAPDRRFNMLKPIEKSKYFNDLRKDQKDKNSLYDYINKQRFNERQQTLNEIYATLQNFYGGKIFYRLIAQIKEILDENISDVLNDFRLLNARSLHEVISRKISKEGESESIFLINWIARQLTKITVKNDSNIIKINESLERISGWSNIYHEVHEDFVLRKMVASEMWDDEVNNRFSPVDYGDVFEIKYSDKTLRAILLTQTCTLAVRGDGRRAGKLAVLAVENPQKEERPSGVTVDDWDGKKLTFDLDDTITYPIDILDLTSLNRNGEALMTRSVTDPSPPVQQIPTDANWNNGYKKMISALINRLDKGLTSGGRVIEINRTWVPFTSSINGSNEEVFDFEISRVARLDSQYVLNIHQLAQSWSGRIGLPVNVNFMDDFLKEKGEILIHGKKFEADYYVKYQDGKKVEVAVDIAHLRDAILKIYEGDSRLYTHFDNLLHLNEFTSFHYASGLELMTLVSISNYTNQVLQKSNIILNLNKDAVFPILTVTLSDYSKILLIDEEITEYVEKVKINSKGRFECHLSKELLSEKEATENKVRNLMIKEIDKLYIVSNEREEIMFVSDGKDLIIKINTSGKEEAAVDAE